VSDESAHLFVWTVIDKHRFIEVVGAALPEAYASLTEITMDTFEVIRVERGVPKFLADMTEDTIPLEAGIEERAISFSKGCYVGQEVIVRVTHRGGGRVAKKLVRWIADAGADIVPLPESRIFSFDKDIGRVTSAVFSPNIDRVVGLGYVHRDFTASGTEVTVLWNDARIRATVR
jgi:folate-binding protein YgfZ